MRAVAVGRRTYLLTDREAPEENRDAVAALALRSSLPGLSAPDGRIDAQARQPAAAMA